MSPQTIIFIGRSGCGKGTQAKLIDDYFRKNDSQKRPIFYVETGALFRQFIKSDTYTSKLSKEIYDRGERQPNFLAIWNWSHLLVEKLTGEEHIMIDGTPRSLSEGEVLDNALGFYGRRANFIHLNVSPEWSEKNLAARGRADDSAAKTAIRLAWFEQEVVPAIEYFRNNKNHNFIEVDGEQSIEKVHADIVAKLKTE